MSDFIKKVKEEARAVSAAIDNELTVLEGVDGYDPLAHRDAEESGAEESGAEESGTKRAATRHHPALSRHGRAEQDGVVSVSNR